MLNQLWEKVTVAAGVFTISLVAMVAVSKARPSSVPAPVWQPQVVAPAQNTAPVPTDPELVGVQVPIPRDMRLYNRSGSQCVWCTLEMLGRFHKVKGTEGLVQQYKNATGPGQVNRVLTQRGVKFKQVTGRDFDFLEEWVTKKRLGCGIGVNGNHAILVCHFERGRQVKVIDNSDPNLRIQTWEWDRFTRLFSGWAFVVLPDTYEQTMGGWNNDVDDGRVYGR